MNDMQLGESMRALPRAKASPAFTSKVMFAARRAEEPRPRFAWRMAAAFAMLVCLVGVVHVAVVQQQHRQRVAALRAEQQQIEAELAAVKKIAGEEPVFVLENDKGTRVVMDLDSAAQPASLRTFD